MKVLPQNLVNHCPIPVKGYNNRVVNFLPRTVRLEYMSHHESEDFAEKMKYSLVVDEAVSEETCRQFRMFLKKLGYVHRTTCMIAQAHSGVPDGQNVCHLLNYGLIVPIQLATKDSNELVSGNITDIGKKVSTEYMDNPSIKESL